jgi:hypothetical protein
LLKDQATTDIRLGTGRYAYAWVTILGLNIDRLKYIFLNITDSIVLQILYRSPIKKRRQHLPFSNERSPTISSCIFLDCPSKRQQIQLGI